ncbi:MAG: PorP/SprF family type IX secretion system membrane protein [Saprospiraceae bacterium]
MKRLLPIFILITLALPFQVAAQQYPLFTNYVMNCFGFNPGVAGSADYVDVRLGMRSQWVGETGAPQTQILSAHGRLKKLPIGVGGYVFNDVAGSLKRTGGSAVMSYSQIFTNGSRLCVGLAGGYYNFRLDNRQMSNAVANDPTLINAMDGSYLPDFNAGIYYRDRSGFFLGVSVPQVAGGTLNFSDTPTSDESPQLMRHYYFLGGYDYKVNDNLTVQPSFLVKNTAATATQLDISLVATMKNGLWGGVTYRTEDAMAAMLGFNISRKLSLGYAYDLTMSELNNFSSGSHEISVGYKLGLKDEDRDEDGIPDHKDKCPDEPGVEELEGCPEPLASTEEELDTDKDGILDKDDKCVTVPGLKENDGCPWGDRDNDGIRDDVDKCPDVSGLASNDGCPLVDRDNDGVVDNKDKCPDIAGSIANLGCPGEPKNDDHDGDGIPNALDKCPTVPGYNGEGCPNASESEREILALAIRNVYFDTDKSIIKRSGYRYLDDLAELLIRKRDYRISIEGFADPRGDEYHNLRLSRRRAESVRNYLLNRGVRREQMRVDFFGEENLGRTEDALQESRRVEMRFLFD